MLLCAAFMTFAASALHATTQPDAPGGPNATAAAVPAPTLTVLCYHNIDLSSPKDSPYSVTSAQFVEEITALRNVGFSFVSLDQVKAFYYQKKPLPPRSALLTFDDGRLNVYERAYPVLKKMKIPWVLFVFPTAIEVGHKKYFMNWSDLSELSKAGVAIGCHAYDHPFLTRPPKEIAMPESYSMWLDKELVHSKNLLEERLGRPVLSFAVPFGALNMEVQRHIRGAGYLLSFNVFGSNNDAASDPLQLNRIMVLSSDTPDGLVRKATEPPLHLVMQSPDPLGVAIGSLTHLSFTLDRVGDYDVSSIRILINGNPPQSVVETGSNFVVGISPPNRDKGYLVTIRAHKKSGESCSQSWYFNFDKRKPSYIDFSNKL